MGRERPGEGSRTQPRSRRLTAFDAAGVLALAAFVAVAVLDSAPLRRPRDEISLQLSAEALAAGFREGIEWQGLYRDDTRVGFCRLERRRLGDGYHLENAMVLRGSDGAVTRLTVITELDESFTLRSFRARSDAPVAVAIEGTWTGDALELEVSGIPGMQARRLPMPAAPAFDFSLAPLAARSDLQPGDRFTFTHFDPLTLASAEGEVELVDREPIEVLGETVGALHLRQRIAGQVLDLWVNELGEVLREELPSGLVARREPEAEATWGFAAPGAAT